jgi:hypothetical protein
MYILLLNFLYSYKEIMHHNIIINLINVIVINNLRYNDYNTEKIKSLFIERKRRRIIFYVCIDITAIIIHLGHAILAFLIRLLFMTTVLKFLSPALSKLTKYQINFTSSNCFQICRYCTANWRNLLSFIESEFYRPSLIGKVALNS